MRWLKVRQAAEYAGGLSQRTVYSAIKSKALRAARIGAGRNVITSEEWITDWLRRCSGEDAPGPTRPVERAR